MMAHPKKGRRVKACRICSRRHGRTDVRYRKPNSTIVEEMVKALVSLAPASRLSQSDLDAEANSNPVAEAIAEDWRMISSDWHMIGGDLCKSIERFQEEKGIEETSNV